MSSLFEGEHIPEVQGGKKSNAAEIFKVSAVFEVKDGCTIATDAQIIAEVQKAWTFAKGNQTTFNQAMLEIHEAFTGRWMSFDFLKNKNKLAIRMRKREDIPALRWYNYAIRLDENKPKTWE